MPNEKPRQDRLRSGLLSVAILVGLWSVAEPLVHHRHSMEPEGSGTVALFVAVALLGWIFIRDRRKKRDSN